MGTFNLKKVLAVNLKHQFKGPFFAALVVVMLTPVLSEFGASFGTVFSVARRGASYTHMSFGAGSKH